MATHDDELGDRQQMARRANAGVSAALWLDPIPSMLREQAVADLEAGDVAGFLFAASNRDSLDLVAYNARALRKRGLYEAGLLDAFTASRTNNFHYSVGGLKLLFASADRAKLRANGDPLPSDGPFTLYRGVAGRASARRVRGLSWTSSLETAQWFAGRFASLLADPAVYQITVDAEHVLAYLHEKGRDEHEFIVLLPQGTRPKRVSTSARRVA